PTLYGTHVTGCSETSIHAKNLAVTLEETTRDLTGTVALGTCFDPTTSSNVACLQLKPADQDFTVKVDPEPVEEIIWQNWEDIGLAERFDCRQRQLRSSAATFRFIPSNFARLIALFTNKREKSACSKRRRSVIGVARYSSRATNAGCGSAGCVFHGQTSWQMSQPNALPSSGASIGPRCSIVR